MHRFWKRCGHEQGVKLYRKAVQTIFDLLPQMRNIWRDGRPRRAGFGAFGDPGDAPCPVAGASAGLEVLNMRLVLRPGDRPGQLRGVPGPGGRPARQMRRGRGYRRKIGNIGQMFIGKENRERESGKRIGKENRERGQT